MAIRRFGRAERAVFRGMIGETVPAQFRPAEPPLGEGIAPVGMAAPVLAPRARLVDLGSDLDRAAGGGIPKRRSDQAAYGDFDLDERTAGMKRFEGNLAALGEGAVDGIGHRSEVQFVPETFDAPQLAIGGKGHAIDRPRRRIAAGAPACLFLGQAIGAFEDPVLLVNIERLAPKLGKAPPLAVRIGEV